MKKLLRSSDSVFSECNLSDYTNSNEQQQQQQQRNVTTTPQPKKDDLAINPVLSHPHLAHHRMCERSKNMNANAQQQQQQQQQRRYSESVKNDQLPSTTTSNHHQQQQHNPRVLSKDLKNEEIRSASNKTRQQQQQKTTPSIPVASSNDLNGTKIFENFNKELFKSIKVSELHLFILLIALFCKRRIKKS